MATLGSIILRDTLANRPAAATAGRLFYDTTNSILYRDSGSTWESVEGATGGGGGAPTDANYLTTASNGTLSAEVVIPGLAGHADRAGIGGSAFAEEYDTSTTGLTWTPSTPNTVDANTTALSHLYIRSNDTTERFGYRAFSPAGDFDVRCKLVNALRSGGTSFGGVGLMVASADNTVRVLVAPDNGQQNTRASISAFTYASSTYTQRGSSWLYITPPYLRISRVGSAVSQWFSHDGLGWTLIATTTFTITPTQVGFRVTGGNTPDFEAHIDWLRATG